MTQPLLLEIDDITAGLLVKDPDGYRFFSAGPWFDRFDARVFETPRAATGALRAHWRTVVGRSRRAA